MIYFDYAASCPPLKEVLEVMKNSLSRDFANPSSSHRLGRALFERVEKCREEILEDLLGKPMDSLSPTPSKETLLFTSGATESNNQLITTLTLPFSEIWYHRGDHPSVVEPALARSQKDAVPLRQIPLTPTGGISWPLWIDELKSSSSPLVLLTFVHNQTGMCFDFEKKLSQIKEVCPSAFIHIDAAQGYAKYALSPGMIFVDSLTVSSHKIGGPKGIGGLYLKNLDSVEALLKGGGQEFAKRSSTLCAPLIFGFAKAAQFWSENRDEVKSRLLDFSHQIKEKLLSLPPPLGKKIEFPFGGELTSPSLLGVLVKGISSDVILRKLEERGIIISSSAACSSRSQKANSALEVLGWNLKKQKNFLRISLGAYTCQRDIDQLISSFQELNKEISYLFKE